MNVKQMKQKFWDELHDEAIDSMNESKFSLLKQKVEPILEKIIMESFSQGKNAGWQDLIDNEPE